MYWSTKMMRTHNHFIAHTHTKSEGEDELAKSFESFVMLESRLVFLDQPLCIHKMHDAGNVSCCFFFSRQTMFPRVHLERSRRRVTPPTSHTHTRTHTPPSPGNRQLSLSNYRNDIWIWSSSCFDVTVPPSPDSLQPSPTIVSLCVSFSPTSTLSHSIQTHKLVRYIRLSSRIVFCIDFLGLKWF